MTDDQTEQLGLTTASGVPEQRPESALRHADRIALLRAQGRSLSAAPTMLTSDGPVSAELVGVRGLIG